MALVDRLWPGTRVWEASSTRHYAQVILNSARNELHSYQLQHPLEAAISLGRLYDLAAKLRRWQDHGDVALHLVVAWPTDLAYVILYALRDIRPSLPRDPVPLVLKALG